MIHAFRMSNPTVFNVRPVQRLSNPAYLDRTKLTYLCRFTNDLDGRVIYAYPVDMYDTEAIKDYGSTIEDYQYSELCFDQVGTIIEQDVYKGKICLDPSGFWYYEICEVYFFEGLLIDFDGVEYSMKQKGYAPINFENEFQPWNQEGPEPTGGSNGIKGQLGILVEEGKLQVKQKPEQVTYESYEEKPKNNYIYNGE